ncbi:MAG TPA: hypothetical protein VFO86_04365 [Terriglobia bacterium]|nr:hypothetical protein [Terriglobia bacterium]
MSNFFMGLPLPLILVFGMYHLMTWFNIMRINSLVYWKRVALVSALAHVLLATGFFIFTIFDYHMNRDLAGYDLGFGAFLFDRSQFWPLMTFFDTLPMVLLAGIFFLLDWMKLALPGLLVLTVVITYLAGTVEWYLVGGGVGALLSRFWAGLKTEDEDWE